LTLPLRRGYSCKIDALSISFPSLTISNTRVIPIIEEMGMASDAADLHVKKSVGTTSQDQKLCWLLITKQKNQTKPGITSSTASKIMFCKNEKNMQV